jgi:hypothetical protein
MVKVKAQGINSKVGTLLEAKLLVPTGSKAMQLAAKLLGHTGNKDTRLAAKLLVATDSSMKDLLNTTEDKPVEAVLTSRVMSKQVCIALVSYTANRKFNSMANKWNTKK